MAIPFLDLKAQFRSIEPEIRNAIDEVLQTAAFSLGPSVDAFERAFAEYCGVPHCVAVSDGTAALHLALKSLDIGHGDEVITTPHTFVATAWAISYTGATPVFVDIDPDTYTIDPAKVEAAVTTRTKALLPVHLYGQPAHMDELLDIARRHDLPLVEDSAQSHGAEYNGRRCGSMGDVGCFSFYPGKNLGAFGEAGALTTSDAVRAERLRRLRNHAQPEKYIHTEIGHNYRMDGIQGAVLGVKLRHLDAWIEARRRIAAEYDAAFAGLPDLRPPFCQPAAKHVYHLYELQLSSLDARDRLQRRLTGDGIGTGLHYPIPVHLQQAYTHLGHKPGDFPVTERAAETLLSLPMFPEMSAEQVERVCTAVLDFASETVAR